MSKQTLGSQLERLPVDRSAVVRLGDASRRHALDRSSRAAGVLPARWLIGCCGLVLCFRLLIAQAAAAPIVTIDGAPFDAKLQAVDQDWNLQFAAAEGNARKLPAAKVVQWGAWPEISCAKQVVFADGSVLAVAEILGIQNDKLVVESDNWSDSTVRLPLASVAGVVFQAPLARRQRGLLEDRLLVSKDGGERALLANGDELAGTVASLNEMTLQLKSAGATPPLEVARLQAIVLRAKRHAKPEFAGLSAWVGLRDGSRLHAAKLVTNDEQAQISLAGDIELRVPLEAIVTVQPVGGDVVYLSELKAAGYKHIPFLSLTWEYRNDRSVEGNALYAVGQRWLFGLGMHSAARITYDLDGAFRRFEALLAIDEETAGRGSVVGKVFTDDGDGEWKLRFESPIVRGGQAVAPVSVDLAGVKRLSLLIDFADRGDEGDHADWLNARLIR